MRGEKNAVPIFRLDRWTVIAAIVLVFLAGSVYAQDLQQRQQESERLFSAAVAAERRGDLIEAELHYQKCRELAQKHRLPKMEAAALHRLAVIRAQNNRFSESANMFRRAIELDPRNALILSDYAQLYAGRRNLAEAEVILKNALNIDPNNPRVLFNLGVVIATQRGARQTEGLRYLKLAVGDAEAYRELARIYRAKGDVSRAEFTDQRAQLAENRLLASSDGASESARLSQRVPHQPQTPPEIVNRVRQELIELEMHEIAEAQRNAATSPVAQAPFMPTPTTPPGAYAANPRETFPIIPPGPAPQSAISRSTPTQIPTAAVPPTQPPVAPPVDPFAMPVRQQEPPPASIRRLEPPPVDTVPAQPVLRVLPNRSESLPVQATERRATSNEIGVPPRINVTPSAQSGQNWSQCTLGSGETFRHLSLPSAWALPSGDGRATRATMDNPLRQIQAGRADLIDSGADTSLIVALPVYSAVGVRRMLRTDPSDLQGRSDIAPNATTPQPGNIIALKTGAAERIEGTGTARPLIVRDVDVLQSPSAVTARREAPESEFAPPPHPVSVESTYVMTNLYPEPPPVQATPGLEHMRDTPNDRRFSTATTPDVLSFVPANTNTPPAIRVAETPTGPVETEVRPLEPRAPSSMASLPVELPQIVADNSDRSKVAAINVTPAAPPAPAVADPFPMLDDQPGLAEVRRTELRPPVLPTLVSSAVESANPFPVASLPPRVAEARTELVPPPVPVALPAGESVDSFPVASNLPRLAEARTMPFSLTAPAREPVTRSLPVQEESAGFASSRRTVQEVRVSSNDESAGFARSRR